MLVFCPPREVRFFPSPAPTARGLLFYCVEGTRKSPARGVAAGGINHIQICSPAAPLAGGLILSAAGCAAFFVFLPRRRRGDWLFYCAEGERNHLPAALPRAGCVRADPSVAARQFPLHKGAKKWERFAFLQKGVENVRAVIFFRLFSARPSALRTGRAISVPCGSQSGYGSTQRKYCCKYFEFMIDILDETCREVYNLNNNIGKNPIY